MLVFLEEATVDLGAGDGRAALELPDDGAYTDTPPPAWRAVHKEGVHPLADPLVAGADLHRVDLIMANGDEARFEFMVRIAARAARRRRFARTPARRRRRPSAPARAAPRGLTLPPTTPTQSQGLGSSYPDQAAFVPGHPTITFFRIRLTATRVAGGAPTAVAHVRRVTRGRVAASVAPHPHRAGTAIHRSRGNP